MRFLRSIYLFLICLLLSFSARAGVYDDLIRAAQDGDTPTAIALIERGMDVNTADSSGMTLVMFAAQSGNEKLLDFLISQRANVRKKNRFGDSALMLAALKGQLGCATRLVAAGAPVDDEPQRWNPLTYAAFEGHAGMVSFLISKGAEVDTPGANGATALIIAARNGHIKVVDLLLKHRADPNFQTPDGDTALKQAVAHQNTDIAAMLQRAGATR